MTDPDFTDISVQIEDGVVYLSLRRPPLNILNIAMLKELEAALQAMARDTSLRLLVLRAEGKLFSAGVDISDHTADRVGEMIPLFNRVCQALAHFPAPTLAVVQGHALGGGLELVLCCDLSIVAARAKLGQPEIKLATFAPIAAVRLPALVGRAMAAELLFTGKTITGDEAARLGLVNQAVEAAELEAAAAGVIEQIQPLSAVALRLCKQALQLGASGWQSLDGVESIYLQQLMATADVHEGLRAYEEKRTPVWQHR